MNRTIALFAVMFVFSATQTFAAGDYKLDAKGNCHAANGSFAKKNMCVAPPKHCRDPKSGRFAKCSAPGAVPG